MSERDAPARRVPDAGALPEVNLGSASPEMGGADKLREEIRSLRQQRRLAWLSAIGAVLAFAVSNTEKLADLVYRTPRIQVVTEDPFVSAHGHFTVTDVSVPTRVVLADSVETAPHWYALAPGAYQLAVLVAGDTGLTRMFSIDRGERRSFVVPGFSTASLRVKAVNATGPIGPGTPLSFEVTASGNGSLWVFERRRDSLVLVYPMDCLGSCNNQITVAESYRLPDASGRSIRAGVRTGRETLLFLVTSRQDLETARILAKQFEPARVTKAEGTRATDSWGFTELSYDIRGR